MNKKCTCPSGDGSLRWPCPTHVTLPMPAEPVATFTAIDAHGPRLQWRKPLACFPIGTHLYAEPQATFQQRVQPWMMECFGAEISADRKERNHRFLEEALELVQATGCTQSEAHQLVDYVFGRPVGEPAQEVGGVMVTLAALCLANGLDMHQAGETELARIWTKVEAIRAKQAAKPKHSPLPQAQPVSLTGDLIESVDAWFAKNTGLGGCSDKDVAELAAIFTAPQVRPAKVLGDVLPPIGSKVYIRHARDDDAHACIVTGYYAWCDLGGSKFLHRVFVQMVYEGTTTENARMLSDCYPTAEAALARKQSADAPTQAKPVSDDPAIATSMRNAALEVFDGPECSQEVRDAIEYCYSLLLSRTRGLTQAARDVLIERGSQISTEGWTPGHDDKYVHGELGTAAGCYAMYTLAYPKGDPHHAWPFSKDGWKPSKDPRRNRVIACALLLAEIERMDRRAQAQEGQPHG